MEKYILTEETKKLTANTTLHRIQAIRDFGDVKSGDLGGWIEKEDNLSHYGDCWVYDNALVNGNAYVSHYARVFGNAQVCDKAQVGGYAQVYGNTLVNGYAQVFGDAIIKHMGDFMVFRNTWSSGRWFTWTRSNNMWKVGCFYGTGEELIKKAYSENEETGRCYEICVNMVQQLFHETCSNDN